MRYKMLSAMIVMAMTSTSAIAELSVDTNQTLIAVEATAKAQIPTLPSSFTHIETVNKNSVTDMMVPYHKYRHDNGLTVILHEDHSDPIARVELSYRVGAANEPEGRKGLAHFFEHMMFEGTKHHPKGLFDQMVNTAGGSNNAYTTSDITKYHETAPSNHLERLLWLESDRMGFFLETLDDDLVEAQRKVIRNERLQNVDQNPYRVMSETTSQALYPVGHPYHTPVLGFHDDIDNITTKELKEFFLEYYAPNNAVLVIGGDIDVSQTLQWIDRYFGDIPSGQPVSKPKVPDYRLEEDRYISVREDVQTPLMDYNYPLPNDNDVDIALSYLSSILSSGKESLLYKRLIQSNIASEQGMESYCRQLACSFSMWVSPKTENGYTLADADRALQAALREYEKNGISNDAIEVVKDQIRASQIYGLQSVNSKVDMLSSYELRYGDPKKMREQMHAALAVTKQDIMSAYDTYIKDQPKVIMTLLPKNDPAIQPLYADNWQRPVRAVQQNVKISDSQMRLTPETFDRTIPPVSPPTPALSFPKVWEGKLDNGIKVYGASLTETPMTAISLSLKAGALNEPKKYAASITANMLEQGTTLHSAEALNVMTKRLGSSVSFYSGERTSGVNIISISDNLDDTLAISEEMLFQPAFPEADFERIKSSKIQRIKESIDNETGIATDVFYKILYPEDINTIDERLAAVSNLSIEDSKNFYNNAYSADGAVISVVSDLDKPTLLNKLAVFNKLPSKTVADYEAVVGADISKHLYFVDKPDANQSVIMLGKHALKWDATGEYFKNKIMNYPLGGGSLSSRINQTLREKKGYTYGAGSGFSGDYLEGEFKARLTAKTKHTADALRDLIQIINDYRDKGITDAELEDLKQSFGQGDVMSYETPGEKLGYLFDVGFDNLPKDYNQQQHDILANITKDEINAQAQKWLGLDDAIIVVVGDKSQIGEEVKALAQQLDIPFTEVDYNAQPIQ